MTRVSVNREDFILPTKERGNHGDVLELNHRLDVAGRVGVRNVTQFPLDRYLARNEITQDQYSAGMALYALWRAAGFKTLCAASYEPQIPASGQMSQTQAEKCAEYFLASRAVGRQLWPPLMSVCCLGISARDWAKANGHNPVGGLLVLKLGLDRLGEFWGHAMEES